MSDVAGFLTVIFLVVVVAVVTAATVAGTFRQQGRVEVASGQYACDQHRVTQEWTCWRVSDE